MRYFSWVNSAFFGACLNCSRIRSTAKRATQLLNHVKTPLLLAFIGLNVSATAYAEATSVDVYLAKPKSQQQMISLTGTVEANQDADLTSLQAGVIKKLFVEVGDQLTQGQPIILLDDTLAKLTLKELLANKNAAGAKKQEAQRLYAEVVELSKQKLAAATLLAQRQAELSVANAEFEQALAQYLYQKEVVARHSLTAPFNGVVAQRNVAVGEWVTQQTSIVTLVEQENLRVKVGIPQAFAQGLLNEQATAASVSVNLEGTTDSIKGKLSRIVPVANAGSRTLTALISLPANANALAGTSAQVDIIAPTASYANASQAQVSVWLPKSAIKQHPDGGRSVFIAQNNQAKRLLVNVVETEQQRIAVSFASGAVANGDGFVVSGVELLKDGDAIRINKSIEASE